MDYHALQFLNNFIEVISLVLVLAGMIGLMGLIQVGSKYFLEYFENKNEKKLKFTNF